MKLVIKTSLDENVKITMYCEHFKKGLKCFKTKDAEVQRERVT